MWKRAKDMTDQPSYGRLSIKTEQTENPNKVRLVISMAYSGSNL